MPRLTEAFARKLPQTKSGTDKHWDSEVKGLVLFVGERSKTWYVQRDVGGQTRRVLIGRHPVITAETARQTAPGFALDWGRGAGKKIQIGAPTLLDAMEAYLARPKRRSGNHKLTVRQQFDKHLRDWLRLPLDKIGKSMVGHGSLAGAVANHPHGALAHFGKKTCSWSR